MSYEGTTRKDLLPSELTSVKRLRESGGRLPDGSGFFTATVKTKKESAEGGPGSGPRKGDGGENKSSGASKAHDVLTKHGFKLSGSRFGSKDERGKGDKGSPGSGLYKHADGRSIRTGPEGGSHSWTSYGKGQDPFKSGGVAGGWGIKNLAKHLSTGSKGSHESGRG